TGTLARVRGGPDGTLALPFDPAHIRALVIGSADIGEILMRAFILRRTAFIQEGGAGSVLIGRRGMPRLIRIEGFLARNAYTHTAARLGPPPGGAARDRAPGRPQEGPAADDLPERRAPEAAERSGSRPLSRHPAGPRLPDDLRRRDRRRRSRRSRRGGVWRVG